MGWILFAQILLLAFFGYCIVRALIEKYFEEKQTPWRTTSVKQQK